MLNRKGEGPLRGAAEILNAAGRCTVLVPTTGPGSAGPLAREAVRTGASLIVVAGGDGTVNEVLAGVAGGSVPLGILPSGTANVLANEMNVSTRIERAAAELANSVPRRISLGRVRFPDPCLAARYFLLMAGSGLDARVVYRVSAPLKAKVGRIAYWIAGFGLAGRRLDEFEVKVEGRSYLCSFALVSKVRNYGGDLEIARDISLFDDCFEVVLFSGRNSLLYLKYLAGVTLRRVSGMRGVTVLRAREVELAGPAGGRVYIQVDGEFAGRLPATVEVVPDALTLLVPPGYIARQAR